MNTKTTVISQAELEKQEKSHQEEIQQMKMRFFINISHEMRTPLTLIINPLQEMITKSNDTWMRKQLKYVERNAKRSTTLARWSGISSHSILP